MAHAMGQGMQQVPELVATFLAHTKVRSVPLPEEEAMALESLLVHAWEESRARWPTVALPAALFVRHVAERLPPPGPSEAIALLLTRLSLVELYLACACLQGMASAHEAFERAYLARLPEKLRGLKQADTVIDDVRQKVRVKLLVATPEHPPRIADYTGRGALMNWVLVIAGRTANKLRASEKHGPEDSADELIQALPGQGLDPELDMMKRRHHADFRQAVREATATLSAEDRHLLRLHFADRLSTYEMAPLFRVNQSTISRWLKRAQQQVYEETRRRLQERLGLTTEGFKSFLAFVDSQLDLTLSQLLEEQARPPPTDG